MANKGTAILVMLVNALAMFVGYLTCGIGMLVVAPFVALFTANMYKQFQGQPVRRLIALPAVRGARTATVRAPRASAG